MISGKWPVIGTHRDRGAGHREMKTQRRKKGVVLGPENLPNRFMSGHPPKKVQNLRCQRALLISCNLAHHLV